MAKENPVSTKQQVSEGQPVTAEKVSHGRLLMPNLFFGAKALSFS